VLKTFEFQKIPFHYTAFLAPTHIYKQLLLGQEDANKLWVLCSPSRD